MLLYAGVKREKLENAIEAYIDNIDNVLENSNKEGVDEILEVVEFLKNKYKDFFNEKVYFNFFSLYSLSFANIYEKLNDFTYEKKPNKDFKIQEVKLVQFSQENKDCLELLIEASQVRILNSYNSCQKLSKDESFQKFSMKIF